MKKYLKTGVVVILFAAWPAILAVSAAPESGPASSGSSGPAQVQAESAAQDPNQLFYTGSHYYQKQDYVNAVEQYVKLLDMGLESSALYYNIGNGFLKLGKIGYAILCYEKAKRLTPHDSDLKSNLAYAHSLIGEAVDETPDKNIVIRMVGKVYSDLSLGSIAVITLASYLILCLVMAIFIINPIIGRKFGLAAVLLWAIFITNTLAFCVRYYGEVLIKHGVIVKKGVEAKYEPIDKSTTFYQLKEGNEVRILKTKEGWRQIRRFDGKTGWIKKDAAEEI
jgi:tetratricopeptide (TPR) repeat protein